MNSQQLPEEEVQETTTLDYEKILETYVEKCSHFKDILSDIVDNALICEELHISSNSPLFTGSGKPISVCDVIVFSKSI